MFSYFPSCLIVDSHSHVKFLSETRQVLVRVWCSRLVWHTLASVLPLSYITSNYRQLCYLRIRCHKFHMSSFPHSLLDKLTFFKTVDVLPLFLPFSSHSQTKLGSSKRAQLWYRISLPLATEPCVQKKQQHCGCGRSLCSAHGGVDATG